MDNLRPYNIDLKSLAKGRTEFVYDVDDGFFHELDQDEIHGAKLHVIVTVDRKGDVFDMTFVMDGDVIIQCDRCLDDMTQHISSENEICVEFGAAYCDDGGDVITVPEKEGVFNIAWILYEFAELSLPIQRVHKDGECNAEMMDILKQHSGDMPEELKSEESPNNADAANDSRWDDLKKLL